MTGRAIRRHEHWRHAIRRFRVLVARDPGGAALPLGALDAGARRVRRPGPHGHPDALAPIRDDED